MENQGTLIAHDLDRFRCSRSLSGSTCAGVTNLRGDRQCKGKLVLMPQVLLIAW